MRHQLMIHQIRPLLVTILRRIIQHKMEIRREMQLQIVAVVILRQTVVAVMIVLHLPTIQGLE